MRKKLIIILTILLTIPDILVGQKQNTTKYPYQLIDINYSARKSGHFVINNANEFWDIFGTFPPSGINLYQNVLIVIIGSTGGCSEPKISIEMVQNTEIKAIDCFIRIDHFGACRKNFHIQRGIVAKKPPTGYVINVQPFYVSNKLTEL